VLTYILDHTIGIISGPTIGIRAWPSILYQSPAFPVNNIQGWQ